MTEFEMVLPFLTDNPKWVEGFECGQLYERMRREGEESPIKTTIHAINDEQIRVMANRLGWQMEVEPAGASGWAFLTLWRRE